MIDSVLFLKPFDKDASPAFFKDKSTIFLSGSSFTHCMRMTTQRIYNTDTSSMSMMPFLPNTFIWYIAYGSGKNWLGHQNNGISRLGFMILRDNIVFLDGNYMQSLEYRRAVTFVVDDCKNDIEQSDTTFSDIYFPRWIMIKRGKDLRLWKYFSEMRWADDWERYIDFSSQMDEFLKEGLPLDRGKMISNDTLPQIISELKVIPMNTR